MLQIFFIFIILNTYVSLIFHTKIQPKISSGSGEKVDSGESGEEKRKCLARLVLNSGPLTSESGVLRGQALVNRK